jgi:thiosulfate/3-mercaptopyruvate sulfurtransferase
LDREFAKGLFSQNFLRQSRIKCICPSSFLLGYIDNQDSQFSYSSQSSDGFDFTVVSAKTPAKRTSQEKMTDRDPSTDPSLSKHHTQPLAVDSVHPDKTSHLVSAAWLFEHLNSPNIVVVDCRFSLADPQLGRQQYNQCHIPGAFYLDLNQDLSSPVQAHGGRHPLPDPDRLAATLGAIGVQSGQSADDGSVDETHHQGQEATWIVAYDDSRFAFAARLWWLVRFLGHDRIAVLDGGFQAWQAAGYPVTEEIPMPQPKTFVPRLRTDQVVNIEYIKEQQDNLNVVLVDSREGVRYRGEQEPIDPIAGHIPGAVNYPWQDVTDSQGFMRSIEEQQHRWSTLPNTQEIIVYCGSGVTACVNLLSLEVAGLTNSKLYAGSWSDWCSYL